MPSLQSIFAIVFSVFFIITIYYFIIKVLKLMKKDISESNRKFKKERAKGNEWLLEVVNPGANRQLQRGDAIALFSGLTMGRRDDNSLKLDDPYVSYYHVRFFTKNGRFVIEDLKSTNGTKLNDEALTQKTYLRENDQIVLGNTVFRVVIGG